MDYHTFCQKFNICGLNEQQEAAVRRVNGATLLLAVPGSGKTTVIVARTGYLMYVAGVKPENILTITYTRAAAKEMKERFIKKFAPERIPAFSTINSFCLSVINTCAKEKYIHVPKLVLRNRNFGGVISMFENGKFPTIEELLERGEHLIQKAVDGKRLSGEETHFLELQNIWLAQRRDEQEKNCVRPLVEQLKKTNPFVQDVFRSTEYSEFALWCIEIPTTASRHNDDGSNDICGCWITADNSTTYEEMCRRLEGVKTKADILALSTTPSTVEAISTATPRWRAEVEQLRAQQQK